MKPGLLGQLQLIERELSLAFRRTDGYKFLMVRSELVQLVKNTGITGHLPNILCRLCPFQRKVNEDEWSTCGPGSHGETSKHGAFVLDWGTVRIKMAGQHALGAQCGRWSKPA